MGDDSGSFLVGGFLGILLCAFLNGCIPSSDAYQYKKAIRECEKSLPRDEHCVVIGVKIDKN